MIQFFQKTLTSKLSHSTFKKLKFRWSLLLVIIRYLTHNESWLSLAAYYITSSPVNMLSVDHQSASKESTEQHDSRTFTTYQ
jgi:hypothetical protein